jgi:hypothetical protein
VSQVFISYSHKDKDFVQYLIYRLSQRDVSLWLDEDRIYASEVWRDTIHSGLNTSDAMILVVTPDSMDSDEVRKEWQYFLSLKRPVIPLILKKSNLHYQLENIQRIDNFVEINGFDNGFTKLINALQKIGIDLDPRFETIAYKTDSFDLDARPFFIGMPELLISRIRTLNYAIRTIFPYKYVENIPIVLTHKEPLMCLLYENKKLIRHDELLTDVSNELNLIDQFLTGLLPHYADKFLKTYQDLLSSNWIKVAYLDHDMDKLFFIETLPPDEVLLTELYDLAKEFANEFTKRWSVLRRPPPFASMITEQLTHSGLIIHGVAINGFLPTNQNHGDWIKVHCGYVRIDWEQSRLEEKKTAEKIVVQFLLDKFWYLTSFR